MVVRISSGSNPRGAVSYNEEKVEQGEARRLALRNYVGIQVPHSQLTSHQVAQFLENQAALNPHIGKPTFHVSLSLAPGEKPDSETMRDVADRYMLGMAYGRQPYVIYQHFDTEHTHVHIVSVRVDENGRKVNDRFERQRSNELRQRIEEEFGLIQAEKANRKLDRPDLSPVQYGQGNMKDAVSRVVTAILTEFRFSSFDQFNSLLKQYNVQAVETHSVRGKFGLIYTVTNGQDRIGGSFKSSTLSHQPTRETVERRIKSGKKVKEDSVSHLRRKVQTCLIESASWLDFQLRLQERTIRLLPLHGPSGQLAGLSFLDISKNVIYESHELGKGFSTDSLKLQLGTEFQVLSNLNVQQKPEPRGQPIPSFPAETERQPPLVDADTTLLKRLLQARLPADHQHESEAELKKMARRSPHNSKETQL